MKTATKIALARSAYRVVHAARLVTRQGDTGKVTRRGINYFLDLREGIDFSIFLFGAFEPGTTATLRKEVRQGDVVLDIGANVGAHTLHLAECVGPAGRVVAFEPTEFAFNKLTKNLSLNPNLATRVTTLKMFLSSGDVPVPDEIYSSWPLISEGELHGSHLGKLQTTSGTPARPLDQILVEHKVEKVNLVKMDVDGFECSVLGGAQDMMRRDKPTFVMELAPYVLDERGASLEELLSYFLPLDYQFYDERSGMPVDPDPAKISNSIPFGASRNVIARATPSRRSV